MLLADRMLLAEFEQLARLEHPSLPRVFEVGRTPEPIDDVPAGAPFFVAEWIAGGRCDARRWDDPRALWSLLADIAGALAVIHAAGLVHGDVAPRTSSSPSEGRARCSSTSASPGGRGSAARHAGDMAPEAFGGLVEPRGDLYSLGAVAAHLALGHAPFEAATLGELVHRIVTAQPPALPGVPAPLADLIRRLMARDLEARPASALAVLDELDQLAPAIAPDLAKRARPRVSAPPAVTTWPGAEPWIDDARAGPRDAGGPRGRRCSGLGCAPARRCGGAALAALRGRARRNAGVIEVGTLDALTAGSTVGVGATVSASGGGIDSLARSLRARPALVVVDLRGDPPRIAAGRSTRAGERFARGDRDRRAPPASANDAIVVHAVPRLDADGVRALATAMLGKPPPAAWIDGLLAASGGLAGDAIALVQSIASDAEPFAIEWSARTAGSMVERRARQLAASSSGARTVALACAVWGGHAPLAQLLAVVDAGLAEVAELERTGLARRSRAPNGDELAIDRATADAACRESRCRSAGLDRGCGARPARSGARRPGLPALARAPRCGARAARMRRRGATARTRPCRSSSRARGARDRVRGGRHECVCGGARAPG